MADGNFFQGLPDASRDEQFEEILKRGVFRIERIVTRGQTSPPGFWYDQPQNEWVLLLQGKARLRFDDEAQDREMKPGDYLLIAAHRKHRVEWTEEGTDTVWLAVFF